MANLCKHITQQRGIAWLSSPSCSIRAGSSFRSLSLSHSSVRYFRSFEPKRSPIKSNTNLSSRDPFDRLDSEPSRKFTRQKYGAPESNYNPRGSNRRDDRSMSEYPRRERDRENMYDRDRDRGSSYRDRDAKPRDYDPRPSAKFEKPETPKFDLLYSPNVVLPALKNGFRTPQTLYYTSTLVQNRKKKKDDPVMDCIKAAKDANVPVVKVTKHELNTMADQRPHQGVVLEASKLKENMVLALGPVSVNNRYGIIKKTSTPEADEFSTSKDEPPVWIALDEVVDPQNLGAIMRTALFMGVDGVVVCRKNSAPLSAVVAKASVGALEARPTYGVRSLMRFIQESQKNGWKVVGAHVTYGSKRNRPIHLWPETGVDQPTILVVGNEGVGLRKQIMNQCDTFIQIPKVSRIESNVDSLNVSVAAGVILSKLMGGRFMHLPKNLKKFPLRGQENGSPGVANDNDDDEEDSSDSSDSSGSDSDSDSNSDSDSDSDDDDDDNDGKKGAKARRNSIENKPLPF